MNEMAKEWKREDRKEMRLSYPMDLDPSIWEYHKSTCKVDPRNTQILMQRLNGMFGFRVKLVLNGRKFTGHLHKNGRGNGLVVINSKGKPRMFEYDDVNQVKWNRLHDGTHRMEIKIQDE